MADSELSSLVGFNAIKTLSLIQIIKLIRLIGRNV